MKMTELEDEQNHTIGDGNRQNMRSVEKHLTVENATNPLRNRWVAEAEKKQHQSSWTFQIKALEWDAWIYCKVHISKKTVTQQEISPQSN